MPPKTCCRMRENESKNKASQLLLVYQLKRLVPGITIGCAAILLVIGFYLGAPLYAIYDEIGKTTQHQVSTVTNILSRPITRGNLDPAALVSIQVGNKVTVINSHYFLHNGEKLSVDYKIGRSGILYIDNFQPISAARPN